jgi:hypothetical protein
MAMVIGTLVGDTVNGAGGLALLAAGLIGRAIVVKAESHKASPNGSPR